MVVYLDLDGDVVVFAEVVPSNETFPGIDSFVIKAARAVVVSPIIWVCDAVG